MAESSDPPASPSTATTPSAEEVNFLAAEPPPWLARALAWLVIALFAAAAVGLVVISLPDTVSSPFMLVPERGTDPVRAQRGGVVDSVRVTAGQAVKQGDPVVLLRSSAVGDRTAELRTLEGQAASAEDGRGNARVRWESQRRADDAEAERLARRVAQLGQRLDEQRAVRATREAKFRGDLAIQQNEIEIYLKEVEIKRTQAATSRELAQRLERAHKDGTISWLEFTTRQMEAARLAVDVQQVERSLETSRLKVNQIRADQDAYTRESAMVLEETEAERREARTSLDKLRHNTAGRDAEYREQVRRLAEDADRTRIRIGALAEDLRGARGNELAALAPCAGTVLRLMVKAPGAVVQEGETLGEVACAGERLQAEISVPQSGVAEVKPGQSVKFLYDAFPYQRFGVKYGTVRWVSPAAVTVGDKPVFRVLADIERDRMMVDGQLRPVMAGMGGRADIVVGRRALISYAFEPLRQLRETLADRPKP